MADCHALIHSCKGILRQKKTSPSISSRPQKCFRGQIHTATAYWNIKNITKLFISKIYDLSLGWSSNICRHTNLSKKNIWFPFRRKITCFSGRPGRWGGSLPMMRVAISALLEAIVHVKVSSVTCSRPVNQQQRHHQLHSISHGPIFRRKIVIIAK